MFFWKSSDLNDFVTRQNRLCDTIVNIIEIKKVLSILSDYHRATANFIRLPFFPLEHSILVEIMCFF